MPPITVKICTGPKCKASFSEYIQKRLLADKIRFDPKNLLTVETCLCTGNCKSSPVLFIDDALHEYMNPIKTSELVIKKLS